MLNTNAIHFTQYQNKLLPFEKASESNMLDKLKIHKSITKNIFNPKIKVRLSKKSIPSLTDINSSTQRSSLNKINSMIINNNKANILNDTNKLQTEKDQKEEKKDE